MRRELFIETREMRETDGLLERVQHDVIKLLEREQPIIWVRFCGADKLIMIAGSEGRIRLWLRCRLNLSVTAVAKAPAESFFREFTKSSLSLADKCIRAVFVVGAF